MKYDLLRTAIDYAAIQHREQFRKAEGKIPYVVHPLRVAIRLMYLDEDDYNYGIDIDSCIIAAVLHDTVEDTSATIDTIRSTFGDTVAGIVEEVTHDTSLEKEKRKKKVIEDSFFFSENAKIVKISDRLDNLNSMEDMPDSFKKRYLAESEELFQGIKGVSEKLDSEFKEAIDYHKEQMYGNP